MIKILFSILLPLSLFSFDKFTASKIFDKVFSGFENRSVKYVYTSISIYKETIELSSTLVLSTLDKSDIVMFDKVLDIDKTKIENKILFSTNYRGFKNHIECVGAFYWFKGRPQIVFLRDRLKKQNIKLKPFLQKYIIDEL